MNHIQKRKQKQIRTFNPNGVGVENGNFIGLPFDKETADIIIYPVPFDVTVSYGAGTSKGYRNVLDASYQLDLYLAEMPDFWKRGIFFDAPNTSILEKNDTLRKQSEAYIQFLEQGNSIEQNEHFQQIIQELNIACTQVHQSVYTDTKALLARGKKVALLGGEHSVPLGYLRALGEKYGEYGILQLDAHCDLRKAYEGFQYSHASIFYNVLNEISQVKQLTQIGIRDYCHEEAEMSKNDGRISLFTDAYIQRKKFEGRTFHNIVEDIIITLPQKVYVSFDIDALNPSLCPNTGTPVAGGFEFNEAVYILHQLKQSGKEIIGIDLCEVGGDNEWDGNVGARILYYLMSLL